MSAIILEAGHTPARKLVLDRVISARNERRIRRMLVRLVVDVRDTGDQHDSERNHERCDTPAIVRAGRDVFRLVGHGLNSNAQSPSGKPNEVGGRATAPLPRSPTTAVSSGVKRAYLIVIVPADV